MSQIAPTRELTADELVAELRATLAWCIDRVHAGGGVGSCTGLDDDTLAALYRYAFADRTPAALAAVHAAAEQRIAGIRRT
jgi:hypothetical protein